MIELHGNSVPSPDGGIPEGRHMMRVSIRDPDALRAVSPTALSAYARAAGWRRHEPYRARSDVYVGEDRPEIIVPRTDRLGDYASVVAGLIDVFAQVVRQDELAVYRSLVTADRDVVHVRAGEDRDGSVALDDAVYLIGGARDLLLAAACSLWDRRAFYQTGAHRDAMDLVAAVRLGQADRGNSAVNLLTPVVPPPSLFPDDADQDAPLERRLTLRLMEALAAARQAADRLVAGNWDAFGDAVESGVSANLCEALDRIISSFPPLGVCVSWARTRPVTGFQRAVRFGRADAPLLREAARLLRGV